MAPDSPEKSQNSELQQSLLGLSDVLMEAAPLAMTLQEVAVFAASAIPGADGVGLTMLEPLGSDTMVASTDLVRAVDEVQYRVGEGPCIEAVKLRGTQVSGSLGGERRWPKFGPQAGRLGVHSALSLPLIVADKVIGALNVYGHSRDAFTPEAVAIGERFSRPAAVLVANARALELTRRLAQQLQQALDSRAVIDQAIGIVMSRSGASVEEAFDSLRLISQTEKTKVADVADALVVQAVARARARHPSP